MGFKNSSCSILKVLLVVLTCNITLYSQTTLVKGKLLDVDGKPSKYALAGIAPVFGANAKEFVKCDAKGNYSIKITKPGVSYLLYCLPGHSAVRIPILNSKNKKITIDVKLAPYKYVANFDSVGVIGTFNGFDHSSVEKMKKRDDGTYIAEVKAKDVDVTYQLTGIEKNGRTINAPGSYSYEPDSSGDYSSVQMAENGKASIIFDPSKLIIKDEEPKIVFKGSDADKKIYENFTEYEKVATDASQKMREQMEAKKNPQDFHYDASGYLSGILKKTESEKDQELKDYLKLIYTSFANFRPLDYSFEKASQFFESVSPKGRVWELVPGAFFAYHSLFSNYRWNEIQDKFLKESKSQTVIMSILNNKLVTAKFSGNKEELKKVHDLILTNYADIKEAKDLLGRYPIESKVTIGSEIPAFEVVSLDNSSEKYSKQSMLGKIYMIDFWATWCGPCVGEMEKLHKAYEKFKDKGFELLSLSLDQKVDDVIKFRNDKWKMPWKHSFINNAEGRNVANSFEVFGIPKPILVGADGKVLAMESDLRGDKLEETLSKYFK